MEDLCLEIESSFMSKNTKPLFTIITVALSHLGGLQKTWQSLKEQACQDFEWIVVDGGSLDGTVAFLQTVDFPSFRWISEKDDGLYDAMNKGIEMAQGTYLLFLNAGDQLAGPKVLANVKYSIETQSVGPDFIYGDAYEVDERGRLRNKPARSHQAIWYGMFTHHQAMFYKRNVLDGLCYKTQYTLAADFAFTSEFLVRSKHVLRVKFPICVFEGGGKTSSTSAHLRGMKEQFSVCLTIQRRSLGVCIGIFLMHVSKHIFIRLFRPLYTRIRYTRMVHNAGK